MSLDLHVIFEFAIQAAQNNFGSGASRADCPIEDFFLEKLKDGNGALLFIFAKNLRLL